MSRLPSEVSREWLARLTVTRVLMCGGPFFSQSPWSRSRARRMGTTEALWGSVDADGQQGRTGEGAGEAVYRDERMAGAQGARCFVPIKRLIWSKEAHEMLW
jgi:hypothetical protein